MSRTVLAVSVALALLLPLGMGLVSVGALEANANLVPAPDAGDLQVLPYATAGVPSLRSLPVTSGLVASEADLVKAEPPPIAVSSIVPNAGEWLRDQHRGGLEAAYEVWDGVQLASHTTVVIDTNVKITGSVVYDHVTLLFTTAEVGHRTIEVVEGGSLTITNSLVKGQDEDSVNYGLIQSRGDLNLDNNRFEYMVVYSQDSEPEPDQHLITNNFFTNSPYGIQTDRDNVLIQDNVFFQNSVGIYVLQPRQGGFLVASNPDVLENTFEMNEIGLLLYTDQTSGDADPVGLYRNNVIRGNLIGVQCLSNGWTNPDNADDTRPPRFEANNIYNNWGDAVNNLRGITIIVPLVGPVSVADSACFFTGNYFGTDSLFTSSADTVQNNAASPLALTSTPALPYPLMVITNTQTWSPTSPPPTITGPVIVASGGQLTIQDITLSTAFTVGSAKGGRITVQDVTVTNGNGVVVRNDADVVDDSSFLGTRLFSPVTVFRNNATVSDSTFVGAGRDRGTAISLVAGQFTEDFTWSPDLLRNTIRNSRFGVTAVTMTVTMTGNTIRDIGTPEFNYPLQALLTGGFTAVIVTLNSQDNTYERVGSVYSAQALTLSANGDTYDGGLAAFNSFQLNTVSITDSLIANYEFGLFNILESSVTVSDTNFTHNAYGLWSGVVNPTITGSNFFNNYLAAMYPYTTSINAGGEQLVTSTITCTSCFAPSDESWISHYGSSVAYSAALSVNDVPKPAWESKIKSVSGAGNVLTLASGTLEGPVIARNGGEVKVENVDLDFGGRFPLGAKGGGNSGGSTGKVTVANSVLTNGGFLALNGTSSTVKNSVLRGFTSGAALFSVLWNGPTVECNRVDMAKGFPGRVLDIPQGNTGARFLRNSFVRSGDLDVGFGLRGDVFHNSTLVYERNSYASGTTALGAVWLIQNGTHLVRENNFLSNPRGSAFNTTMVNRTGGGLVARITPLNAQNNFYGDASGPSVRHGLNTELNPGGQGLRLNAHVLGPAPQWSPYTNAAHSLDPCISWRSSPTGPRDFETLSFNSDLSFDPSGFPLSYSWNFNGEGSSTAANPTFKFADGGAKTVTLTVTTQGGKVASLSRSITVAHSAPVAGFGNTVADEVTAMAFTDASTHPNAPVDAPPQGWSFAWNLNGEASSSLQNPSHTWADGGSKTVTLTVTDNDGQSHSLQKTISVAHVAPLASFAVTGTLETDTYQLTDTSTHPNAPTDGIATRAWSCTDGFTSTLASPTHKFADGGSYSCTLTVTDNDGLTSALTKSLGVAHVAPVAGFGNGAANELQAMAFTDATVHPNPADAPPTGYTYAWSFGDNTLSSARNPSHDYADGGSYTVSLTVTDNDGQTGTVSRSVSVPHVPPVAAFSFLPANPDLGEVVQFSDLSTHPNAPVDGIVSWSWSFGDGATSTDRNPSHTYQDNGLFDATLTVTDDDGQTATLTIRVPVGNTPPVPAFSANPATPTTLDDVQFTDLSTDEDGTIVAWLWEFGDGTTSTEQNPVHRFADNGLYTVRLTVTDNLDAASSLSQVLEVLNVAATASFTFGPDAPTVNQEVTFADTSVDPDGTVVAWAWDFGDGATSSAQNPRHTFTAGGDYTVSLTVTDDDGAQTTVSQTVHVCETGLDVEDLRLEVCLRIEL